MVIYFALGLLLSLALTGALVALLVMFLRKNWNHANKTRLSYLAPIVLIVAIVYLSMTQLVPRVFDLVQLVNRQYNVREIEIPDEVIPGTHTLKIDGQIFFFPPGTFESSDKGRYQITYTPRTLYIINVVRFGDIPEN